LFNICTISFLSYYDIVCTIVKITYLWVRWSLHLQRLVQRNFFFGFRIQGSALSVIAVKKRKIELEPLKTQFLSVHFEGKISMVSVTNKYLARSFLFFSELGSRGWNLIASHPHHVEPNTCTGEKCWRIACCKFRIQGIRRHQTRNIILMYLYQKFRQHSHLGLICPKSNEMSVIGAMKPLRKTAQHLNDIHCERDTCNCYEKSFLILVLNSFRDFFETY
jgi:hypothetical protein